MLSAFRMLGEDFRFRTLFYTDARDNLLIRGTGDPLLTSEELRFIASQLKQKGYRKFARLYLDDNLYEQVKITGRGSSANPYDAQFSALFVNFNTMNLVRSPNGKIMSAEKQTPTLPLAEKFAQHIPCCDKPTRINLGDNRADGRKYAAQLIEAIFHEQGIEFKGKEKFAWQNKEWQLIYTHYNSHSLEQLSQSLLLHSNNLIANALLLQFSDNTVDPLNSSLEKWKKDLQAMDISFLKLYEGSGLDRRNQVTPLSMLAVLNNFRNYIHLLPPDKSGAVFKTGSLNGVSNAIGFLKNPSHTRAFVIFRQEGSFMPILDIMKQIN